MKQETPHTRLIEFIGRNLVDRFHTTVGYYESPGGSGVFDIYDTEIFLNSEYQEQIKNYQKDFKEFDLKFQCSVHSEASPDLKFYDHSDMKFVFQFKSIEFNSEQSEVIMKLHERDQYMLNEILQSGRLNAFSDAPRVDRLIYYQERYDKRKTKNEDWCYVI